MKPMELDRLNVVSNNLAGANGLVETLVNLFINGYGQFLLHFAPLICIVTRYVNSVISVNHDSFYGANGGAKRVGRNPLGGLN